MGISGTGNMSGGGGGDQQHASNANNRNSMGNSMGGGGGGGAGMGNMIKMEPGGWNSPAGEMEMTRCEDGWRRMRNCMEVARGGQSWATCSGTLG